MARFHLLAHWRGRVPALRSFDRTRIKPMRQATHSLPKVLEALFQICPYAPLLTCSYFAGGMLIPTHPAARRDRSACAGSRRVRAAAADGYRWDCRGVTHSEIYNFDSRGTVAMNSVPGSRRRTWIAAFNCCESARTIRIPSPGVERGSK